MSTNRTIASAVLLLAAVALSGCAPAVGVKSLSPEAANRELTANVLNTAKPSAHATEFLYRADLAAQYEKTPDATLATLRAGLGGRDEHDRLYALAELSYHQAHLRHDPGHALAAALYAWAFLFPDPPAATPDCYDPRLRVAMDVYNRGLAEGLKTGKGDFLEVSSHDVALPFATVHIDLDERELTYGGYRLGQFKPLVDLETHGFRNRYRRRGIGAPLAASAIRTGDARVDQWIGPRSKVPMTAVLHFENARAAIVSGDVRAHLELHDVQQETTTRIAAADVPLEADLSAALAYRLQGSPLWDFELAGFRRGDLTFTGENRDNLYMIHPYLPGRIPVVFVHGTASSPARWAEMLNELSNDPVIGRRYQFWFYLYNSGNPIAYSAAGLRAALAEAVESVDPQATDPALQQMVVVGHSQGGLLTKLMAVDSGSRFWDAVSTQPLEKVKLAVESRRLIQESLFFHALPFVKRLVFIATPHRGSVLADHVLGNLARRLVSLPGRTLGLGADLVRLRSTGVVSVGQVPTSIDNMKESNPFLKTLVASPIAPGVKAHSIIAVRGKGPPEEGSDGVVAYTSAYLDGMESTYVVRSSHSTQAVPATIEEVRRILYVHLAEQDAGMHGPQAAGVRTTAAGPSLTTH